MWKIEQVECFYFLFFIYFLDKGTLCQPERNPTRFCLPFNPNVLWDAAVCWFSPLNSDGGSWSFIYFLTSRNEGDGNIYRETFGWTRTISGNLNREVVVD